MIITNKEELFKTAVVESEFFKTEVFTTSGAGKKMQKEVERSVNVGN